MAADGMAALEAQIARLRKLGKLVSAAAPRLATAVDGVLRSNISSGRGADGKPLQPTKDGKQPLKNAGKALSVKAVGNVVLCELTGPEALHHLGRARGRVVRPILPTDKIPYPMVDAMKKVATEEFEKVMEVKT